MLTPIFDQEGFTLIGIHIGRKAIPHQVDNLDQYAICTLVARIVSLALEKNGLAAPADNAAFMGTLIDGMITVKALRYEEALEVIKVELETIHLRQFQLGVVVNSSAAPDGWRWLCVHPGPQINFDYLMDRERHELAHEKQVAAYDRLMAGPQGDSAD